MGDIFRFTVTFCSISSEYRAASDGRVNSPSDFPLVGVFAGGFTLSAPFFRSWVLSDSARMV